MSTLLLCPECGSDDIAQFGTVAAKWGGRALLLPDGTREWEDDGDGADVVWDAVVVEEYICLACGWTATEQAGLAAMTPDKEVSSEQTI